VVKRWSVKEKKGTEKDIGFRGSTDRGELLMRGGKARINTTAKTCEEGSTFKKTKEQQGEKD